MKICTKSEQCKVLLIEDYPDHAALVTRIIEQYGKDGFAICHHPTLADGLTCIRESDGPIDIILLDLNLEDSRGMATLEAVLIVAPDVPIVVLTSDADEATAEAALELGAQDYVVKEDALSGGARSLSRIMRYAIARNRARLCIKSKVAALKLIEQEMEPSQALSKLTEVRKWLTEFAKSA